MSTNALFISAIKLIMPMNFPSSVNAAISSCFLSFLPISGDANPASAVDSALDPIPAFNPAFASVPITAAVSSISTPIARAVGPTNLNASAISMTVVFEDDAVLARTSTARWVSENSIPI